MTAIVRVDQQDLGMKSVYYIPADRAALPRLIYCVGKWPHV